MVKYIVAGFHKTGTKSLAMAFRQLGYRVFDAGELHLHMRDIWCDFFSGKKETYFNILESYLEVFHH